jgi:hypothetical protein
MTPFPVPERKEEFVKGLIEDIKTSQKFLDFLTKTEAPSKKERKRADKYVKKLKERIDFNKYLILAAYNKV